MSKLVPMPPGSPPTAEAIRAWGARADELVAWTKNLIVCRDAYGRYKSDREMQASRVYTKAGRVDKLKIEKSFLDDSNIRRHYRATAREHIIGPLTVNLDNLARYVALDIDCHDHRADPRANLEAAISWYDGVEWLGMHPLLVDSNGCGGFHMMIYFPEPVEACAARGLGRWIVRDWSRFDLRSEPEVFPKQYFIGGLGFGNWLRLPGCHHSRNHWSRVWDHRSSLWRSGNQAIDLIVGLQSSSLAGLPEAVTKFGLVEPSREPKHLDAVVDDPELSAALARDALRFLPNEDLDYDTWLCIGFSLHSLGEIGFDIWCEWSAQSVKFDEDYTVTKWNSMREEGRGLGSLFFEAKGCGWPGVRARIKTIRRKLGRRNGDE
jgi:Primase C terminal 2 (PriCT-2)/TOTE conflict system, Archaeo-Eukaryotic Primase domain